MVEEMDREKKNGDADARASHPSTTDSERRWNTAIYTRKVRRYFFYFITERGKG